MKTLSDDLLSTDQQFHKISPRSNDCRMEIDPKSILNQPKPIPNLPQTEPKPTPKRAQMDPQTRDSVRDPQLPPPPHPPSRKRSSLCAGALCIVAYLARIRELHSGGFCGSAEKSVSSGLRRMQPTEQGPAAAGEKCAGQRSESQILWDVRGFQTAG